MRHIIKKIFPSSEIPARHKRLIKVLHLYFACLWGGGTVSVTLAHCLFKPKNPSELYASSIFATYIDYYIIAPSAVACLLTGIAYALVTKYGLFKYKWIVFKWITTMAYIAFGFFWYMPWLELSVSNGINMHSSWVPTETTPHYVVRMTLDVVQLAVVFVMTLVSVIKPWGRSTPLNSTIMFCAKLLRSKTRGMQSCHSLHNSLPAEDCGNDCDSMKHRLRGMA